MRSRRASAVIGFVTGAVGGIAIYASKAHAFPEHPVIGISLAIVAIVTTIGAGSWLRRAIATDVVAISAVAGVAVGMGGLWLVLHLPGAPVRYHGERAPGFAFDVPDGELTRAGGYRDGFMEIGGPTPVRIFWLVDEVPDEDAQEDWMDGTFSWLQGTEQTIMGPRSYATPGLTSRSFEVRAIQRYEATLVQCGDRVLGVLTGPERHDLTSVHAHVVSTIRCAPDPAEEALIEGVPPVTTLTPDGWEPYDPGAGWLGIGGDEGQAVFLWLDDLQRDDEIGGTIEDALGDWGEVHVFGVAQVGDRDGWTGTVDKDGATQQLLAVKVPCRGHVALGVFVGASDFEPARKALAAARCDS